MSTHAFVQVLEFVRDAERYLQAWFGLDASTAADVVQDVCLRLLRKGPEHLEHPKRYFVRACRWRALQILRSNKRRERAHAEVERRRQAAEQKEVPVTLYEEDRARFFGPASPKQRGVLELLARGHSKAEVSAILEVPESTVRMRVHLVRRRLGPGAA